MPVILLGTLDNNDCEWGKSSRVSRKHKTLKLAKATRFVYTEAESDISVHIALSRFAFEISLGTRLSLCAKGACGSETVGWRCLVHVHVVQSTFILMLYSKIMAKEATKPQTKHADTMICCMSQHFPSASLTRLVQSKGVALHRLPWAMMVCSFKFVATIFSQGWTSYVADYELETTDCCERMGSAIYYELETAHWAEDVLATNMKLHTVINQRLKVVYNRDAAPHPRPLLWTSHVMQKMSQRAAWMWTEQCEWKCRSRLL